jgi:hypothetical protein
LSNRLRHEIHEAVGIPCEAFVLRQLFSILDGRAARYLFIDRQNCSPQLLRKLVEKVDACYELFFAYEP